MIPEQPNATAPVGQQTVPEQPAPKAAQPVQEIIPQQPKATPVLQPPTLLPTPKATAPVDLHAIPEQLTQKEIILQQPKAAPVVQPTFIPEQPTPKAAQPMREIVPQQLEAPRVIPQQPAPTVAQPHVQMFAESKAAAPMQSPLQPTPVAPPAPVPVAPSDPLSMLSSMGGLSLMNIVSLFLQLKLDQAHGENVFDTISKNMDDECFERILSECQTHPLLPEYCELVIDREQFQPGDWDFADVNGDPFEDLKDFTLWLGVRRGGHEAELLGLQPPANPKRPVTAPPVTCAEQPVPKAAPPTEFMPPLLTDAEVNRDLDRAFNSLYPPTLPAESLALPARPLAPAQAQVMTAVKAAPPVHLAPQPTPAPAIVVPTPHTMFFHHRVAEMDRRASMDTLPYGVEAERNGATAPTILIDDGDDASWLEMQDSQPLDHRQIHGGRSTLGHAASFQDLSNEAAIAASLTEGDASAAMMHQAAVPPQPPRRRLRAPHIAKAKAIMPPPPGTAPPHRAQTLDLGLDVLAGQNLHIAPEGASAFAARERSDTNKRKHQEDDALPILPAQQKAKYTQYWNKFRSPPSSTASTTAATSPRSPIVPSPAQSSPATPVSAAANSNLVQVLQRFGFANVKDYDTAQQVITDLMKEAGHQPATTPHEANQSLPKAAPAIPGQVPTTPAPRVARSDSHLSSTTADSPEAGSPLGASPSDQHQPVAPVQPAAIVPVAPAAPSQPAPQPVAPIQPTPAAQPPAQLVLPSASALPQSCPPPPPAALCNSASHPKEYAAFKRFCGSTPAAKEVVAAFKKGGECRLAAFRKYVLAGGVGMAVEAVMRFKRMTEQKDTDEGEYLPWSEVFAHFQSNMDEATRFCNQRRSQPNGNLGFCFTSCPYQPLVEFFVG